MNDPATNQRTDRVLFVWLVLAGTFGTLIGVPWTIAVLRDPATVWLSAVLEVLLFITPASAVGAWLGNKVGLGSRLRDLVSGMPGGWERVRAGLLPALLVGLTLGVAGFFAQSAIPKSAWRIPGLIYPNTFECFLRCLSAALTEEILFRLGLMTLFVWAIGSIAKRPSRSNSARPGLRNPGQERGFGNPLGAIWDPLRPGIHDLSLWFANLLSALLFAAAHLPQLTFQRAGWSLLVPVVIFSSSAGIIMGWVYMRYGLVSAIVAHFICDLVAYVIPR
jgi:hypothetical protein